MIPRNLIVCQNKIMHSLKEYSKIQHPKHKIHSVSGIQLKNYQACKEPGKYDL